jgi:CRP-like cAMP-binding protein
VTDSLATRDILAPWFAQLKVTDTAPFDDWLAAMTQQHLEKDAILVRAGDASRSLYFLHSGLLRLYYTTPQGRERNKAFYGAGSALGAVSAAITGSPAPFSIQALEPSLVVQADFDALFRNAHLHPELSRAVIDLLSGACIRNVQREAVLLTCNAQQRYRWLCDNEPDLLQRVPQFHIASYIGVDAVSLSRLKRNRNRKLETDSDDS